MILNIERSRYSLCLRYINININLAFFKLALEKEKKKIFHLRAGVPFLYLLFYLNTPAFYLAFQAFLSLNCTMFNLTLSHFIVTEVALLKCHSCLPQSRDTPPALDWVEVRIASAMIIQSNQIHFYITPEDGKSSWEILFLKSSSFSDPLIRDLLYCKLDINVLNSPPIRT